MNEIPRTITIAGHEIKVIIDEILPTNGYGYFCASACVIRLAKTIKTEYEGTITLTLQQMYNTFLHEVIHAMQFFAGRKYNEKEAQIYANFLQEIINSIDKPF